LVSAKAVVDLTKVARVRLSPLLGGLGAAAVTTSAAGHLLVRLSHARAAKASLALVKWLTTGAGSLWRHRAWSTILREVGIRSLRVG